MEKSSLRFIADECISSKLVKIINTLGDKSISPLNSQFDTGTPDDVWLPQADAWNFVCVTYDLRMLENKSVIPILAASKVRMIFISSSVSQQKIWHMALWFLRNWPKIKERARRMQPGTLLRVYKNGRIVEISTPMLVT